MSSDLVRIRPRHQCCWRDSARRPHLSPGRRASPNIATPWARRYGGASGDRLEAPSPSDHRHRNHQRRDLMRLPNGRTDGISTPVSTVIQTVRPPVRSCPSCRCPWRAVWQPSADARTARWQHGPTHWGTAGTLPGGCTVRWDWSRASSIPMPVCGCSLISLDWGRTGPTVSHQRLLLLRHPEQTQPLYHASERIRSRGRSREQGRDTERRFQPKHTLERHPTFLQTAGQCQCRSETAPSEGIIRILMDCPRRNRDRLSVFTQTNACPAASMPL